MERSNQLSLPTSMPNVACDIDALFAAYYRRLTRLLYRVTGDTARAEEFAAEAFWRLYHKPPRDATNIEGWLYRTGLHLSLDYLKKERRRARYEALTLLFGVAPNPHQAIEQQEKQARVRQVLASLKPVQAAMLLLRSEGLSYAELAAALNLNPASVGALLARAGQAFKKEYVKRGGFPKIGRDLARPANEGKEARAGRGAPTASSRRQLHGSHQPRRLHPSIAAGRSAARSPGFRVLPGPMVWSTTLNVAKMEESLRQAGVTDQPIPKEWEGVVFSFTTGSAVSSTWNPGEMSLFQHTPLTLSAPAGFDITVYWMAALRAAGIPREQARQLAERMRAAPALLLGIATNNKKSIREVNLRSGPATLIETRGERRGGGPDPTDVWESIRRFFEDIFDERKGGGHVLLIWGVEDRVYHLTARSAEQAIMAANSIE